MWFQIWQLYGIRTIDRTGERSLRDEGGQVSVENERGGVDWDRSTRDGLITMRRVELIDVTRRRKEKGRDW